MRIFVFLLLMFSLLQAELSFELKKGWQLVGVASTLDVEKAFSGEEAEIVWAFDATSQRWKGYSSDASVRAKIEESYGLLEKVEAYQAIWVFSTKTWQLQYEGDVTGSEPTHRSLPLESGWNLVSLPQDIVVSDKLFGDALVWKYSNSGEWKVNNPSLGLPSIEAIKQSEGVWVKSDNAHVINIDEEASKLHTFKSYDAMVDYIREMVLMYQFRYGYFYDTRIQNDIVTVALPEAIDTVAGSDKEVSADDATTTNLQEEGVDEGDILKHNGTYIFSVNNANSNIVVTSFARLVEQKYDPITTVAMDGQYINTLYLQGERLVVISRQNGYSIYDDTPIALDVEQKSVRALGSQNRLELRIYDISNITDIKLLAMHKISGRYEESRVVDGNLFLISQFNPEIVYDYPRIYVDTPCSDIELDYSGCVTPNVVEAVSSDKVIRQSECQLDDAYGAWQENGCYAYQYDEKGAWYYDYDNPNISEERLIPTIVTNDAEVVDLVRAEKFYAPSRLDQSGSITSLSRFELSSGVYKATSAFIGDTHTYYASKERLYMVSSQYPIYYDYRNYKDQQVIYSFALDSNLSYVGKGAVEGRMLNQFSMSEYNDYLRVATTTGWSWWNGGDTDNIVYTLKMEDKILSIQGKLKGLGHEGETIRAVRFLGERGFVVTFRQTDPLYTLDMSDPTAPSVVGELKIPGFSSYLHPIDENRVLSIGRDADATGRATALQFQLFDISDFTHPLLVDKIQIGDGYSYSEAEHNHKAFSYRSSDKMFGVPYRSYNRSNYSSSEHFGIYQVDGLRIVEKKTLNAANANWGDVGRGLIFDLDNSSYGALLKGANMICEPIKGEK